MSQIFSRLVLAFGFALLLATPAHAYLGPALLGAVFGPVFAVIGGVLMLVVGLFWYPVRRILARRRARREGEQPPSNDAPPDGP